MAIDLPAPLEPQLFTGSPTEFRAQAAAGSALSFGKYRIHPIGETGLSSDQQATAIADAETLSDAVRAIAYARYLAGYPATQLRYLLLGEDLYIAGSAAPIRAVHGRPELARYFEPLVGRENLSAAELEPARALAGIEADRRGIDGQLRFAASDDGLALEIDETGQRLQPFGARLNVGNPGNRYAGREFVEAEARLTSGAVEWTGTQRNGLREDGDYDERAAAVTAIAPQGLFGFSGRSARYRLGADLGGYEGQTQHLGLQWSVLPYADFGTRWLLTLRVEASNDRLGDRLGEVLLEERYDSLGADLSRAQAWDDGASSLQLQLALSIDAGRGQTSGDATLAGADPQFLLLRPRITLSADGAAGWTASLELSGQYSAASLPQQQQLVLGGIRNLSAWLPGVAVGDSGGVARAELGIELGPPALNLTPRLFVEAASWRREDRSGAADDDSLADAGAELLVKAAKWLEASVSAAMPLADGDRREAEFDTARADAYFSLTLRY